MTTTINRPRTVALVDFNYLFKRNFMAMPGAEPLAAAKRTLEEFARARETTEHVILCIDAPPYNRRELFAEYKANREPPSIQETEQRRWLRDKAIQLGYQTAWCKGFEADDVIATLARIYSEWCEEVRIIGSDKDVSQCVTDNVIQYVPAVGERKEDRRDRLKVKVKFGVYPEQMALYLALMGDSTDNVPGVKGFGSKTAARFVTEYRTLRGLAEALATQGNDPKSRDKALWRNLADHWNSLKVSLDLVTLDANVPLDAEALLMKLAASPDVDHSSQMDVDLDGFMGNETPAPETEPEPAYYGAHAVDVAAAFGSPAERAQDYQAIIGKDPNADAFLRDFGEHQAAQRAVREEASPVGQQMIAAADRARQRDAEERVGAVAPANDPAARPAVTEAEFDPISRAPGDTRELPAMPPPPAPKEAPKAATPPAPAPQAQPAQPPASAGKLVVRETNYGLTTNDLQPQDLRSARTITEWLHSGGLYPQFEGPATIFTVLLRGKELGLGVTTALAAFHVVEGRPTASADLIRSLAERDPKCGYFRVVETTSTYAIWETWHRDHVTPDGKPAPTRYRYDLEEAEQAGLLQNTRSGKPSMWVKRPRDMLAKTAGSKLARLVYPGATLGLYCPEEMGEVRGHEEQAA